MLDVTYAAWAFLGWFISVYAWKRRLELLDAGIVRLRPVLITVGATVIALFPLAAHGGLSGSRSANPQIGGLCVATVITLLLVPVLYAIFVLDLKWVRWETLGHRPASLEDEEATVLAKTA